MPPPLRPQAPQAPQAPRVPIPQQQQQVPLPPAPPAPPAPAAAAAQPFAPILQQQLLDTQQQVHDFLQRFGAFVQQDKDDREALRKAAQQEHLDKLQNDRDRAANMKEARDLKEADTRAKEIPKCDGSTPELTRKWLEHVELTIPYTTKTIRVASLSSTDELHTELELFLNTNNRNFVTWASLKKHITKEFLSLQEQENLCNKVDNIMRNPSESITRYSRRFKIAVQMAYPLAQGAVHPPMSNRFLKTKFLNGLNHPDLVGRILREGRPDTYEQAIDFAARYEADEQNVRAQVAQCNQPPPDRIEEPMDVNVLHALPPSPEVSSINAFGGARPKRPIRGQQYQSASQSPSTPRSSSPPPIPSQHDQNKAISNLQRQVSGLAKQFTELMASRTSSKINQDQSPPNHQRNSTSHRGNSYNGNNKPRFYPTPLEYTMDGRPICLYCKNPGHLKRDCRKKAAADLRRPSGNQ